MEASGTRRERWEKVAGGSEWEWEGIGGKGWQVEASGTVRE